jgi:dipeptidyl aminopeptidase/acylaminoacyl peptidase
MLQAYDRMMMGDPVTDAELWRDRSPIFFVDRIRAPLLLLAGANDIRCPPEETQQIVDAVQRAGGVAEAKIYEDEGHGFARRENYIDAFRRTADFLKKHLGPEASLSPAP